MDNLFDEVVEQLRLLRFLIYFQIQLIEFEVNSD